MQKLCVPDRNCCLAQRLVQPLWRYGPPGLQKVTTLLCVLQQRGWQIPQSLAIPESLAIRHVRGEPNSLFGV
jgi:hypothetical protein